MKERDFCLMVEPNCVRPTVEIKGDRLTVTIPARFEPYTKALLMSCINPHGLPCCRGLSGCSANELFPQDAYDMIVRFGRTTEQIVSAASNNEFIERVFLGMGE